MFFYGTALAGLSSGDIAGLGLIRTFQTARVFPGMTVLENVMVGGHNQLRRSAVQQMLWLPSARSEERALTAQAAALLDMVGLFSVSS